MKKRDEDYTSKALRAIGGGWAMARVLIEHSQALSSEKRQDGLDVRSFLVVKLVEMFPCQVTQKHICLIFALQSGQSSQLVGSLKKRGIMKEPRRGKPLELTKAGLELTERLQKVQVSRFAPLWSDLTEREFHTLISIMEKIQTTAKRLVEERIFGKRTVEVKFLNI